MSLNGVLDRLDQVIDRRLSRIVPYRAIVTSVGSGLVGIRPVEADAANTRTYARVVGFDVTTNDEVLCLPLGRQPIVIGKIQRTAPSGHTLTGTLDVTDTITASKASGTGLSVTSNAIVQGTARIDGKISATGSKNVFDDDVEVERDLIVGRHTQLGDATSDTTDVYGPFRPRYRFSLVNAAAATAEVRTAAGTVSNTNPKVTAAGLLTDIGGTMTLETGLNPTAGIQVRLTFGNARSSGTSYGVLFTGNQNTSAMQIYYSRQSTYLDIGFNVAPASNTQYSISYFIMDFA